MRRLSTLLILVTALSATTAAQAVRYSMAELPGADDNPFTMVGPSVIPGHEAEIFNLYILPGFHKSGHGRRFFMAVSNRLSGAGFEGLAVWVLKNNPATTFYKYLGGSLVSSRTIRYGSVVLDEVAYGWADIPSYD